MTRPPEGEERTFGNYLRWLRESRKLTREELAGCCDLSADTIRRLEHDLSSPNFDTIRKLARGFGYSVSDLFRGFEGDNNTHTEVAELVALVRGRRRQVLTLIIDVVRTFLRALDGAR